MPKAKKIGKDAIGGKGSAIIQTRKDREDYEDYKRRKTEEEAEKQKKKLKLIGSEKMLDEREPTAEQLAKQKAEVLADIRKLKVKKVVLKEEE